MHAHRSKLICQAACDYGAWFLCHKYLHRQQKVTHVLLTMSLPYYTIHVFFQSKHFVEWIMLTKTWTMIRSQWRINISGPRFFNRRRLLKKWRIDRYKIYKILYRYFTHINKRSYLLKRYIIIRKKYFSTIIGGVLFPKRHIMLSAYKDYHTLHRIYSDYYIYVPNAGLYDLLGCMPFCIH